MNNTSMPNPKRLLCSGARTTSGPGNRSHDEHAECLWRLPALRQRNLIGQKTISSTTWQPRRPWGTQTICPSTSFSQALYCKPDQLVLTSEYPASSFYPFSDELPERGARFWSNNRPITGWTSWSLGVGPYQTVNARIDGIDLEELEKQFQIWENQVFLYHSSLPLSPRSFLFWSGKKGWFWI